jgi:hypothetical protein
MYFLYKNGYRILKFVEIPNYFSYCKPGDREAAGAIELLTVSSAYPCQWGGSGSYGVASFPC